MTEFTINGMNGGNGNGNGHHPDGHGSVGVAELEDEGAELLEEEADLEGGGADPRRIQTVEEEGDIVGEFAGQGTAGMGRRKGRKLVVGLAAIVILFLGGLVVAGVLRGNAKKAHVPVRNAAGGAGAQQTEEQTTREAIAEATSLNPSQSGVVPAVGGDAAQQQPVVGDTAAPNVPVTQIPPVINPNLSGTVPGTPAAATPGAATAGNAGGQAQQQQTSGAGQQSPAQQARAGGRNGERSVSIAELYAPAAAASPARRVEPTAPAREEGRVSPEGVALPTFGSMLPVRSLGVLYSLRSGSLARFELTREVKGRGWSMQRGTVLVGALRGSEHDRAYIALVGFIDPEGGKFIRLSGDVLGTDGGSGIKGKKRKIGGGWSRVFGKLGEAGLNIAGSLAGSVGRRPIVITDAYGSYGTRVTNELDGVLLNRNRREFVEVPAGTAGYIMVTDLPESVQGVDALARLSARDVEEKSDVRQARQTTGISEQELAELIQSGDAERLRAALPRMTPEMRRVAESVLAEGGGGE